MTEEGFRKYCKEAVREYAIVRTERPLRDSAKGSVKGITRRNRDAIIVWHDGQVEAFVDVFGKRYTGMEAIEEFEAAADISISDELDFLLMQDPNG